MKKILSIAPIAPVGAYACCVGGYAGIYDLIGNVAEWRNSCEGETGRDDLCRDALGIPWNSDDQLLRCDAEDKDQRAWDGDNMGFRCCADVE